MSDVEKEQKYSTTFSQEELDELKFFISEEQSMQFVASYHQPLFRLLERMDKIWKESK